MKGRFIWLVACFVLAFAVNQVRGSRSIGDFSGIVGGAIGDPDATAARLLDSPSHPREPAELWLARYGHSTRDLPKETAIAAARAARSAGAVNVLVGEVGEADSRHAVTEHLVIELPADPSTRANVLREFARVVGHSGDPADAFEGVGSRYAVFDTRR